ncbi:synaptic vesicle glycoprotein 2B [Microplitis demolitor]|uniref:synaptic vesicle glycoprotein 2B n=1 Tax=Microplitis demolitor TaxID=69319 RepID=UPI0006D500F5|nr:synaptic vesicle glycoprotein 2B [Microplitis demolitor]XP_014298139.1 synaptic vesicle glycoprotein 2B [Microplitis demolitor]
MVNKNLRCSVSTIQVNNDNEVKEPSADFETALSATGFGAFNIFLMLALIPVGWANAFDMTSSAFILASAECELELTFIRKGLLCSAVYIGMMFTPLFWGFVSDRLPKRTLMLFGLLIDALCNILCSVIESYYIFIILKFITGTIVSGPFTLLTPYLSEFQPNKYRAKLMTWSGLLYNAGFIIPAILAFNVTPLQWTFILFDREFTAWRLYYFACCIPSILGFLVLSFLPETPKMLMENGYLPRAYDLLRRIYIINNRLPIDTYPIKSLQQPSKKLNEITEESKLKKIRDTWDNIKELFKPPYLGHFLIINLLQFGSMLSFNTLRLWVPHMFIIINNFDYSLWDPARGNPTICEYLIPGVIPPGLANETFYANHTCIRWYINPSVYINSSIIAASAVGFSFLAGLFYTTRLRKKTVLIISYLIAIFSSFGTNWAQLVPLMLTLSASIVVTGRITANIVIAANADVIPIPLRTTAVSFITNTGNLASIIGNLVFPALLEFECLSAFMGIGVMLIPCVFMSLFTLRSEGKKITITPP